MQSLRGHLLIASPALHNPDFFRAVVLLAEHSPDGAFGLVLNRPTDATIRQVWQELTGSTAQASTPVRLGGPCEGPLVAVHTEQALANARILPGVYLTGDESKLERLIAQHDSSALFFVNFSSWGAGQLEGEMEGGAWINVPADPELVLSARYDLWKRIRREWNRSFLHSALGIDADPGDPRMN